MNFEQELLAMKAELLRLQQENAELKNPKRKEPSLSFKVSAKGAVSVYGLGRFPVTLYGKQWAKLLNASKDIATFIEAHKAILAVDKTSKVVVADDIVIPEIKAFDTEAA
jgi:hypothetical protein